MCAHTKLAIVSRLLMPYWETICIGFYNVVHLHLTFHPISSNVKCFSQILIFPELFNDPVWRWSTDIVVDALYQCARPWASTGWRETEISPLEIGIRNQNFEKTEVSSLIDVIIAMTVLFSDSRVKLHQSRFNSSTIMQWWACSSLNPLDCLQRPVAKLTRGLF